jgi:hydroxymethylpyrimidine pyrophosphatase-like HAD family hydrolase
MMAAAEPQSARAPNHKAPVDRISLVIPDVDGTLATPDKELTAATIGAARALREAGAAFTVVSSRPPRGLAILTGPLRIQGALAAYNGAAILRPDLSVIEEHLVPAEAAGELWWFLDRAATGDKEGKPGQYMWALGHFW